MESSANNHNRAFSSCPDATRLWRYAHGKLSTAEQFEVEHHALGCHLCKSAIEGYASVERLPEMRSARERLFKGRSKWWTLAGISVAVLGILWSGGLFRSSQKWLAPSEPLPPDQTVAPAVVAPVEQDTLVEVRNDSAQAIDIRHAKPSAVTTERLRRWGDELFMIEKRGVEVLPVTAVKPGVKGRSRMDIVYIEGLKVVMYKDRFNGDAQELEVARSLHPRFANDKEPKGEAFYADTDTILYRNLLTDALRAFNYGLCSQVLGQLKSIGDKFPDDQNVLFYSGMCAKNSGDFKHAVLFFSKMTADESSPFHEEAMWHAALCYEQLGDVVASMKLFRRIAEDEGFYSEAAAKKL